MWFWGSDVRAGDSADCYGQSGGEHSRVGRFQAGRLANLNAGARSPRERVLKDELRELVKK